MTQSGQSGPPKQTQIKQTDWRIRLSCTTLKDANDKANPVERRGRKVTILRLLRETMGDVPEG